MGLKENQPNAYDLFESDGWPLLRVLPRDDGSFYLTNLGGMAEKHFKQFVTKDELAEMKRKHKLFKQKELQHQTTIDEFLLQEVNNLRIEIKFNEIFKAPIGSPRPRFRNAGRFVQTYMPTSYMNHKDYIRKQMPKLLLTSSLKVSLFFYFIPPKSWSKNQKLLAIGQYKRTKPDIDNLIKTVLDAANNRLWKDDNQIVEIYSFKQYAERPKIILELEEL